MSALLLSQNWECPVLYLLTVYQKTSNAIAIAFTLAINDDISHKPSQIETTSCSKLLISFLQDKDKWFAISDLYL